MQYSLHKKDFRRSDIFSIRATLTLRFAVEVERFSWRIPLYVALCRHTVASVQSHCKHIVKVALVCLFTVLACYCQPSFNNHHSSSPQYSRQYCCPGYSKISKLCVSQFTVQVVMFTKHLSPFCWRLHNWYKSRKIFFYYIHVCHRSAPPLNFCTKPLKQ